MASLRLGWSDFPSNAFTLPLQGNDRWNMKLRGIPDKITSNNNTRLSEGWYASPLSIWSVNNISTMKKHVNDL